MVSIESFYMQVPQAAEIDNIEDLVGLARRMPEGIFIDLFKELTEKLVAMAEDEPK